MLLIEALRSLGIAPSNTVTPDLLSARLVSPRGCFFTTPTFHYETLRNAGYILANCADRNEVLETVKIIAGGDVQSDCAPLPM
jgi:hypothetical protein